MSPTRAWPMQFRARGECGRSHSRVVSEGFRGSVMAIQVPRGLASGTASLLVLLTYWPFPFAEHMNQYNNTLFMHRYRVLHLDQRVGWSLRAPWCQYVGSALRKRAVCALARGPATHATNHRDGFGVRPGFGVYIYVARAIGRAMRRGGVIQE